MIVAVGCVCIVVVLVVVGNAGRVKQIPHSKRAHHLVVIQHGLHGRPTALMGLAKHIARVGGDAVQVHLSHANHGKMFSFFSTSDGIDRGGERLAQLVLRLKRENPSLTHLSLIGYSLGGLYTRYAVGCLAQLSDHKEHLAGLIPVNFITIATPHLGVRESLGLIFDFGVKTVCGRTGKQLVFADSVSEKPLLLRMSSPSSHFVEALGRFQRRCVCACVAYDSKVPYHSAAITPSTHHPVARRPLQQHILHIHDDPALPQLSSIDDAGDAKAPNTDTNTDNTHNTNTDTANTDALAILSTLPSSSHYPVRWPALAGPHRLEWACALGLRAVAWTRVDCVFTGVFERFLSHRLIMRPGSQAALYVSSLFAPSS